MKGLYPATYDTLNDVIINGNWENYVGKIETLGLVSGTDPEANYVPDPHGRRHPVVRQLHAGRL